MVNPYRGEVALTVDGDVRTLRLTLGALAELEATLASDSLMALIERFEAGRFSAADIVSLILAGCRGGGWAIERETLLAAEIEGGPLAAARAGAQLLKLTFEGPESAS